MVKSVDSETTFRTKVGVAIAALLFVGGASWAVATDRAEMNAMLTAQRDVIGSHTEAITALTKAISSLDRRLSRLDNKGD